MSLGLGLGIVFDNFIRALAVVWGAITGTLSDQTDLQSVLDDLAPAGSSYDLQVNNGGTLGTLSGMKMAGGGASSGATSLDIQSYRSTFSQVPSGIGSTCIGQANTASVNYSVAIGYSNTISSGSNSISMGLYNTSSTNSYAITFGASNLASGANSVAMGNTNQATGSYSVAIGNSNSASNVNCQAIGYSNTANAYQTGAVGYNCLATGGFSFAFGASCTANGYGTVAIGVAVSNSTSSSLEIGPNNTGKISIASAGTVTVRGGIVPASLSDAAAPNGTIYYSTTAGKLVYKNSGGTVNNLY